MPTYHKVSLILAGILITITIITSSLLFFIVQNAEGLTVTYDTVQFESNKKHVDGYLSVPKQQLDVLSTDDVYFVMPKVNANWYQITFNDVIIGEVGQKNSNSYIQEYIGVFRIDSSLIQPKNNIKVALESDYRVELNRKKQPVICDESEAHRLDFWGRAVHNTVLSLASGIMIAGFAMYILLYFVENKSRMFLIYSIASIVAPLILITGIRYNYLPISTLLLNKMTCVAFYILMFCLIQFAQLVNPKAKKIAHVLYAVVTLLVAVTVYTPTMEKYQAFAMLRDIINLVVINVPGFIIIRKTLQGKDVEDKLVNFALLLPIAILALIATFYCREILTAFSFIFMELYFCKTVVDEIIKNKEHIDELKFDTLMIKRKAERDNLTGLYNQAAILRKVQKSTVGDSIGIIDIDRLKQINDEFGHNIGTKAISLIGDAFVQFFPTDEIGRYGGDEFIIVSKTSLLGLVSQLKKTNEWIGEQAKNIHPKLNLTISSGVAIKGENMTDEDVLEAADRLLYEAKTNGRNCVRCEND
jgi:diguanylate cyclase (GGDEF)-like protein